MKSTQTKTTEPRKANAPAGKDKGVAQLFDKENYKWMLIGLVVVGIGFILMAGGKSSNPNVFNDNDVYSFRRITLAPILIIAGFIIEIYAIMRKPKTGKL
jgi:hypothetical protein